MSDYKFKLSGSRELKLYISSLDHKLDRKTDNAHIKFCRMVFEETQRLVPVRTGKLKRSGSFEVVRRGTCIIRYDAPYAAAVEFGHRSFPIRRGAGAPIQVEPGVWRWIYRVPAQPPRSFIRRAIENVKSRLLNVQRETMRQIFEHPEVRRRSPI